MPDYALVVNGELRGIQRHDEKPEDIPHKNAYWYEYLELEDDETAYSGVVEGKWVVRRALPSVEQVREGRKTILADLRWQKETGGMVFSGMNLATDPVSQTKYIGAFIGTQINPNAEMQWKLADGTFVTLDATGIAGIAVAVREHVQACFDREAQLRALLDAAQTREEVMAVDIASGWPSYGQ